ncbi:thiamine pyrophosphate-binding protein [Rubrobacter radiotolerans]|uniref:Thiamine pyrophosphate-binding protein n=1 Tax=Rubrobacter radiotolerans TaxID=42256 RepID=A0AB35T601_RUBRA|nr:thiamine pyrophosphate-binding protein [Rubrobacter radiotolerans]MDX5895314.1 thiamine pyrophosphate-binding protein [Rubrobacter radiotolerans]SMC01626.1 acetolactate synthase-1/2/3 large subunit [Rubrobacter radiotolerans DSM 5868]
MQTYAGAWAAIADYLEAIGTEVVFGLPDDDLALLRALEQKPTRAVLCRDQRNAVFMSAGYALQSGGLAVCVVGKGPALTNALTGVLEAQSTGASLMLIASGTGTSRVGTNAFQELDQLTLIRPLVKWAYRVEHPDRLCWALERAAFLAVNGSPGPVYLEVPEHLLEAEVVRVKAWEPPVVRYFCPDEGTLAEGLRLIRASRRPILLIGGGMRRSKHRKVLERFADATGAAIFVTASGRGAVNEDHPLFCGLCGLYLDDLLKQLWAETDLVIAVGSRLEETATLGWDAITPGTPVVQVNVEPQGFSMEYPGERILGEGLLTLNRWLRELGDPGPQIVSGTSLTLGRWPENPDDVILSRNTKWALIANGLRQAARRAARTSLARMRSTDRIRVAEVLDAVDTVVPVDRILVQENGLQDMWSYFFPYYSCGSDGGSVVPGDQTSLGFGVAAAAGVKLAAGEKPVVAFAGDGAFNVFRSDLKTVVEQGIPVLYVVLNNGGYGWLQHQLALGKGSSSRFSFASDPSKNRFWEVTHPGLEYVRVTDKGSLEEGVRRALAACLEGKVAVAEVVVSLDDVPPGIQGAQGATLTAEVATVEH